MEATAIPATWTTAMRRAQRDDRKATLLSDGRFRVASKSHPGELHYITLDDHGHISGCSECPWWARFGRTNPCGHAGAVAIAIMALKGITIEREDSGIVETAPVSKTQVFRAA